MKPHHDIQLWALAKDGRTATAVLRHVEGYGYELRLLLDGELLQSRTFRTGESPAAEAMAWAETLREQLLGEGWTANGLSDEG